MEKELLLYAVDYSEKYRLKNKIKMPVRYFATTNGLLLDEEFLINAKKRNLILSMSLDGYGEGHDLTRKLVNGKGSFKAISKNFDIILKYYPKIEILMTYNSENIHLLATGVENLFYCGFVNFFIGPDHEGEWNKDSLKKIDVEYEKLSKFYYGNFKNNNYIYLNIFDSKIMSRTNTSGSICSCCDKHDGEIAIAPSGNLYPCLRFVKTDEDDELRIGNLNSGLDVKKRAKIMMDSAKEFEECKTCDYLGRCFHYCGAVNYKITGKFNSPPPSLCYEEQQSIKIADKIAERLYEEGNELFMKRFY